MDLESIPKINDKQDLEVSFECFEEDGTTPVDLSSPGKVEFTLWRSGVNAFEYSVSSEDPGGVAWTSRITGKGTLTLSLQNEVLPSGLCRYQLRSTDVNSKTMVQELSWVRIIKTK